MTEKQRWFERSYARLLIDNHITEEDASFMTRFDPKVYAAMVKRAGVDAAMVYACCHNGNCYYPTKVGHIHKNLVGRDIFGETVSELRQEGIAPIAYYTVIFHNDSARRNPAWRMQRPDGEHRGGRYWYACPNSNDYVDFTKAQLEEIIAYDVEGIFIDMVFWPTVCLCQNCRTRYRKETGAEIPPAIAWDSPEWVTFQRTRERWMADFVETLRSVIVRPKPEMSVTFQFSPVLLGWSFGQSPAIAAACDYTSGDFYGGRDQQSLGTKVLSAFSRNVPFEFMTSRCVSLHDHTSMKSEEEMFCHAAMTLANGGAYFFIDAIDPDGTLNEDVYDRLGRVSQIAKPFKEKAQSLRPVPVADVGLYFSMASHVDAGLNGMKLKDAAVRASNMAGFAGISSLRELLGTSVILRHAHIPYRIVTSDRPVLDGLNALIANDAAYMSSDEVDRLRAFVRDGGTLIATGCTSLYNELGETTGDFQLSDVFGVSFSGAKTACVSYLSYPGELDVPPSESGYGAGRTQYILSDAPSPLVNATTAKILAEVCGTYTDPDDPDHYASIHSNPPGPSTGRPGLTVNSFGKGKCIYLYSSLLAGPNAAQQTFGRRLFREHTPSGIIISTNAPPCVEITVLESTLNNTRLVCFVNYQADLPNVPVHHLQVALRLPDMPENVRCRRVSDGVSMECMCERGVLKFAVPKIETLEMVEVSGE